MSTIDPQRKAIVEELWNRRDSLDPDRRSVVEELAGRFGLGASTRQPQSFGASGSWQEPTGEALARQRALAPQQPLPSDASLTMPAGTAAVGQRALGVGDSIVDTVRALRQWGQSATGQPVSPTPLPSTDPNREFGRTLGSTAQFAALGAATGGASLPVQVAAGGLGSAIIAAGQEQDPTVAAAVGGGTPIVTRPLVAAARAIRSKGPLAARAMNSTMEIPTTELHRGINPGRQLLDDGIEPSGSKELLQRVLHQRRTDIGQELGTELSKSTAKINLADIQGLDRPETQAVLNAMKRDWIPGEVLEMTPIEAHTFRSQLGSKINWSERLSKDNPANDTLKQLYHEINGAIEKAVPGIKALNRKWANYFIGDRSIGWAIAREQGKLPGLEGSSLLSLVRHHASAAPLTTGAGHLSSTTRPLRDFMQESSGSMRRALEAGILGSQPRRDDY